MLFFFLLPFSPTIWSLNFMNILNQKLQLFTCHELRNNIPNHQQYKSCANNLILLIIPFPNHQWSVGLSYGFLSFVSCERRVKSLGKCHRIIIVYTKTQMEEHLALTINIHFSRRYILSCISGKHDLVCGVQLVGGKCDTHTGSI